MRRVLLALWLCGCSSPEGSGLVVETPDDAIVEDADAKGEDAYVAPEVDAPREDTATKADAPPEVSPAKCTLSTGGASSKWAEVGGDTLHYATNARGDRLLDFSWAGYHGGGVAIPDVPVKKTVKPTGGDDTTTIQAAIDEVSKLPLVAGVRGAVLLDAGSFKSSGVLRIGASGVVLRGSGRDKTTLTFSGTPRDTIEIAGTGSWSTVGARSKLTDAYVPAGARSFHVDDPSGFSPGDTVLVDRPVTTEWIAFMGMDDLVRNGKPQTWISAGSVIHSDRVVTAVEGKQITVDAPLSDGLDTKYTSASLTRYTFAGRIANAGLESLRIVAPKNAGAVTIDPPIYRAVRIDAALDTWVRDVAIDEFLAGVVVDDGAKWITLEDLEIHRTNAIDGSSGWPFHLSIAGQQTLTHRVKTVGDDAFPYATQARTPGPNVLLGMVAKGTRASIQPHQRWGTGLLVDSSSALTIDLMNRGYYGSGHGWTMGFGVVWNSTADTFLVQRPPGADNWGIGLMGKIVTDSAPGTTSPVLPTGTIDSLGKQVAPKSLYLAQLCLRLGPAALSAIGY